MKMKNKALVIKKKPLITLLREVKELNLIMRSQLKRLLLQLLLS